jgi:hypothetical protein
MGARVDDLLRSSMVPSTQRMLMLTKFGGPDGFAVVERPVPEPGVGEILVKVLAASVQFTDVILRKGQYPDLKDKPPLVLGYDLVGEVMKVGPGVAARDADDRRDSFDIYPPVWLAQHSKAIFGPLLGMGLAVALLARIRSP